VRDNGDDYRLRLLESRGRTGLRADCPQPFNSERRDGEESNFGRGAANTDGAELAGTLRVGHGVGYGSKALAKSHGRKAQTDLGAISVATALLATPERRNRGRRRAGGLPGMQSALSRRFPRPIA